MVILWLMTDYTSQIITLFEITSFEHIMTYYSLVILAKLKHRN